MEKVTISWIIKTSIITAFTIAAALIWKDVITDFINLLVPPGEELFYKFIAAVLATIFVVVAVYIILKTESETKIFIRKLKYKNKKRQK